MLSLSSLVYVTPLSCSTFSKPPFSVSIFDFSLSSENAVTLSLNVAAPAAAVSYTHLTLPTSDLV